MSEHANVPNEEAPMTRGQLRTALLSNVKEPKRKLLTVFGVEVELLQPSFSAILEGREDMDEKERTANMIVDYVVMPGTTTKVFEISDIASILAWPFGEDLVTLQNAITELTGIDIKTAEADIIANPLSD